MSIFGKRLARPSTFDPAQHMQGPFSDFLAAARDCAENGFVVVMRPDQTGDGWEQQLFIFPESSVLARKSEGHAALSSVRGGE